MRQGDAGKLWGCMQGLFPKHSCETDEWVSFYGSTWTNALITSDAFDDGWSYKRHEYMTPAPNPTQPEPKLLYIVGVIKSAKILNHNQSLPFSAVLLLLGPRILIIRLLHISPLRSSYLILEILNRWGQVGNTCSVNDGDVERRLRSWEESCVWQPNLPHHIFTCTIGRIFCWMSHQQNGAGYRAGYGWCFLLADGAGLGSTLEWNYCRGPKKKLAWRHSVE